MDEICKEVGIWPHAILAGHAHSYQRFTRLRDDGTEIPYLICGNGGHNVQKLQQPGGTTLRAPQTFLQKSATDDAVMFENYDDQDYGYLRLIVTAQQLRIEYHPASDAANAKAPDDSVTIDLGTRKRVTYNPNNLGLPELADRVRQAGTAQQSRPRWR